MPDRLSRWQGVALLVLSFFCLVGPVVSVHVPRVLAVLVPIAGILALPFYRPVLSRQKMFWLAAVATLLAFGLARALDPDRATRFILGGLLVLASLPLLLQLVASATEVQLQRLGQALGLGVLIAALALLAENLLEQPVATMLAGWIGKPVPPFYNIDRAIVITSLLFWSWAAFTSRRWYVVLLIGGASCALAANASSQASVVGLAAGLAVYTAALLLPRLTYHAVRLAMVIVLMGMPFFVFALLQLFPGVQEIWVQANATARLGIWSAVTTHIFEAPWLGHGIEAAYSLPGTVLNHHPHNGVLQLWLEYGLLGVLPAVYGLLRLLENAEGRPAVQAAFAAWLVVFCVSYDYLQPWWIATMVLLIVTLAAASRLKPLPPPAS